MKTGIIELENMEFQAYHGCYELERIVGNRFLVSVTIEADVRPAAYSDNVADSINYLSVYETVAAQMSIKSHILENVASRIVDAIYDSFPACRKVTAKVSKLAPPLGGKIEKVSVTITK